MADKKRARRFSKHRSEIYFQGAECSNGHVRGGMGKPISAARGYVYAASPVISRPQFYRNKPCPCGSGKKFKKCCEDSAC